jgi:hypothetical protein
VAEECRNHPGREAAGHCSVCGKPFCQSCLIEMPDGRLLCRNDASLQMCYRKQGSDRLGILAFVLSLVGFSNPVTAIAGIVIGARQIGRINRGEASEDGRKMSRWAVIIGSIALCYLFVFVTFEILLMELT